MGSRIMHYCISSMIADKLDIKDRNEFLLGGIAPDIHGLMGVAKGVTHFKDRDETGKSRINYWRFFDIYKDVMHEPFYLGYLCHLISDVVWLDLYFEKVEFISPEQRKEKLQVTYRDFERLNGRIIELYSLQLNEHVVPNMSIEGYDMDFLPSLIDQLRHDFLDNGDLMNEQLELFNNDNQEIIAYMNRSVSQCIHFLSEVNIKKRP